MRWGDNGVDNATVGRVALRGRICNWTAPALHFAGVTAAVARTYGAADQLRAIVEHWPPAEGRVFVDAELWAMICSSLDVWERPPDADEDIFANL